MLNKGDNATDAKKQQDHPVTQAQATAEEAASVVTMQGVSGKAITSKVKVFKANKRDKAQESDSTAVAAASAAHADAASPVPKTHAAGLDAPVHSLPDSQAAKEQNIGMPSLTQAAAAGTSATAKAQGARDFVEAAKRDASAPGEGVKPIRESQEASMREEAKDASHDTDMKKSAAEQAFVAGDKAVKATAGDSASQAPSASGQAVSSEGKASVHEPKLSDEGKEARSERKNDGEFKAASERQDNMERKDGTEFKAAAGHEGDNEGKAAAERGSASAETKSATSGMETMSPERKTASPAGKNQATGKTIGQRTQENEAGKKSPAGHDKPKTIPTVSAQAAVVHKKDSGQRPPVQTGVQADPADRARVKSSSSEQKNATTSTTLTGKGHVAVEKADKPQAHTAPAAAGPRKLGNIFEHMKKEGGPRKLEKSGLAATAAAFAQRSLERKNNPPEARGNRSSSAYPGGSYNAGQPASYNRGQQGYNRPAQDGGGYNRSGPGNFQRSGPGGAGGQGGYNRPGSQGGGFNRGPAQGGSGYRPGRPAPGRDSGAFDKDKDDDNKPISRPRKAPAKKKGPDGLELFVPKAADPARSFASRDAIDKNKNRDGSRSQRPQNNRRRQNGFDFDIDSDGRRVRRPKRLEPRKQLISILTHVSLPASLTVKEFAEAIKKTSADVIKSMIKFGEMATLNQTIDYDTASLIAAEYGINTKQLIEVSEEDILFDESEDREEDLQLRPPVVAVMGHVDHGKTSLLDYIRQTRVASGEAGGITQHIGAYMVRVNNRKITFLDTPGHEAFTTMRARGAQATDIAILVVAADDGVMPQTIEAINHAKAANTTIVVAINKIDKPGANIDRVKQELSTHDVISEEWGGDTVMVPVSAKTGEGIDELLEMLLLSADLLDLKANPKRQAKGIVIEAKLDKNRGVLATVLVQRGTLHQGETIVTGPIVGNIRAMVDAAGNTTKKAGPSVPVEILGLSEVPAAGELFYAVEDERVARQLAEKRRILNREHAIHGSSRMSLDNLFSKMNAGEVKDLNIIVKADVVGSVEALRQSLEKLSSDAVKIQVIHQAVGAITESDLHLAEVSNAIVIGFNVRPASNVTEMAQELGVDIRLYRVIYSALEDIEAAMKGMLDPEYKEHVTGHIEIREIFKVSAIGTIGGAYVTDGKVQRNSSIRLVRDGVVIMEGQLASLRRFKDDVKEVSAGYECGLSLEKFNDIKVGDVIEAYEMKEVQRA